MKKALNKLAKHREGVKNAVGHKFLKIYEFPWSTNVVYKLTKVGARNAYTSRKKNVDENRCTRLNWKS